MSRRGARNNLLGNLFGERGYEKLFWLNLRALGAIPKGF